MASQKSVEDRIVKGVLEGRLIDESGEALTDWGARFCTIERHEHPTRFCNGLAVGRDSNGDPRCARHI